MISKANITEPFDMAAEKEKLRLYYSNLKNKKKEDEALRRARPNSNGSFKKHLDWYEDGKQKVMALREQEKEAKTEVPLIVPAFDPSPDHTCNRLYEETRDELITAGREKRKGIDKAREIAHPTPLPSRDPPKVHVPRKPAGSSQSPEEVVKRLYSHNTISLDLARSNPKAIK